MLIEFGRSEDHARRVTIGWEGYGALVYAAGEAEWIENFGYENGLAIWELLRKVGGGWVDD
jgi:hypothetical protein